MSEESGEVWAVESTKEKDTPNRLKRIQMALDTLQVPPSLRAEHHYEDSKGNFAQLRQWADPSLPDPYGDPYSQRYTISDLKRIFGET